MKTSPVERHAQPHRPMRRHVGRSSCLLQYQVSRKIITLWQLRMYTTYYKYVSSTGYNLPPSPPTNARNSTCMTRLDLPGTIPRAAWNWNWRHAILLYSIYVHSTYQRHAASTQSHRVRHTVQSTHKIRSLDDPRRVDRPRSSPVLDPCTQSDLLSLEFNPRKKGLSTITITIIVLPY